MPEPEKKTHKQNVREITEILGLMSSMGSIGFTMIGCILTGFTIGFFADRYILSGILGKETFVGVAVFTLLGIGAGFVNVYKFIMKKVLK
jgi:F0F1-type ATP synthase assembly protein I